MRHPLTPVWERTFESELSACRVTVGILADGRLEVTIEDSAGESSWGERLSDRDSAVVADALMRRPLMRQARA